MCSMKQTSKTVRVNRAALEALRIAGQRMSNLCYNLAQESPNHHRVAMYEGYKEWDAAVRKLRETGEL